MLSASDVLAATRRMLACALVWFWEQAVDFSRLNHRLKLSPSFDMVVADEHLRHEIDSLSTPLVHFAAVGCIPEFVPLPIPFHCVCRERDASVAKEVESLRSKTAYACIVNFN